MLKRLICAVIGHQYRVLRRMNPGARKVGCDRCGCTWGMHDASRIKNARSLSWPRSGQAHAAAVLAVPGRHPSHGPIGQVGGGGSGGQLARQVTRRGESERRRVNLARGEDRWRRRGRR
jgi:hypothetical protein